MAEEKAIEWIKPGIAKPNKVRNPNTVELKATFGEFGSSYRFTTLEYKDIPFYLRSVTNNIPWGNVHMALWFGPLVIENGVA